MCVSRGSSSSASCRQRSPWRCSKLAPAATASTMGTSGDAARGRSAVPQLRCDSLSSWRAAASKHQPPGRGPPNSQRRRQPRYGVPRVVGAPPRRVCGSPRCIAASRVTQPSAAALSCSTPLRVCSYARWRAAHSRMQSNSPPGIAAAGRRVVHVVLYPRVVMCPVHCASFHMHCTAVPQPCSVCESYFAFPCLCLLELCYCHIASGWRP